MARRVLIAGNWKLNKTIAESTDFVAEFRRLVGRVRDCDIVIAPPYTALATVASRLEDSSIDLSAQEVFFESAGAFTGAVSAPMLKDAGCRYVLVGHSERRQLFGETLQSSRQRMVAAIDAGLIPILCVGETLAEREAGQTMTVVSEQLSAATEGIAADTLSQCVVAYEPVWAIGTGKVASPAQAQEVHGLIREHLRHLGPEVAERVRILYGGSVKPDNAQVILAQPDIDGVLVGGASLEPRSFAAIVDARSR